MSNSDLDTFLGAVEMGDCKAEESPRYHNPGQAGGQRQVFSGPERRIFKVRDIYSGHFPPRGGNFCPK